MIYKFVVENVDENFREYYKHNLEGLLEQVPDDSSLFTIIRKFDSKFIGALEICSQGEKFVAKTIEKTPIETMNTLLKQIQNQIRKWHKTRFKKDDLYQWQNYTDNGESAGFLYG